MAITVVSLDDNLDQFRVKVNGLATIIGDTALLATPITSDIVAALNSLQGQINAGISDEQMTNLLIQAIALS